MTDGTFQEGLKVKASSVLTDRTKKSLNRCHWLLPGASGSACATAFVSKRSIDAVQDTYH